MNDTTLSISYEAKEETNNIVSYNSFHRSWTLPINIDPASINAEYNQGILSVIVPKPEAEIPVSHRIKVK